ncbi:MAG: outer membrane protein [Gemmatimonadaceae bacterium]
MRKAQLLLVMITAVLAVGEKAGAQIRQPQLGIYGGLTLPRGDWKLETDLGWHAGALGKVRVTRTFDARIDGAFSRLGSKSIDFANASVESESELLFGTLVAELNLGPDSAQYPGDNSVSPYIHIGPGIYRYKFEGACSGDCAGFAESHEETKVGLTIGAGANVPFGRIPLFAEFRWHRFGTVLPVGQYETTVTMFTFSAGFKIR